MDLEQLWAIIEASATPAALHARLGALSADELVAFEQVHGALFEQSYRWDLWGAAYVIEGGCGDDTFDYFRAYLISLGRQVFEAALADPDSLAAVGIADGEDWEDWMSPTMMVIHARTGTYAYAAPADPNHAPVGTPTGEEWEEDDLPERFPRLSAKYD